MAVSFDVVDPRSDEAVWAMTQYFGELDRRFRLGFDATGALEGAAAMSAPAGVFVVGHDDEQDDGEPVACGGLQALEGGIGEIKRMWVAPSHRGRGVGRGLLESLEAHAARLGFHTVRLDTNSQLPEAVSMYRRSGYQEIDRYNDNPYPDHFFEKRLAATS